MLAIRIMFYLFAALLFVSFALFMVDGILALMCYMNELRFKLNASRKKLHKQERWYSDHKRIKSK